MNKSAYLGHLKVELSKLSKIELIKLSFIAYIKT